MSKTIFSTPDDFSISPLLQLLPVKSSPAKLKELNSSLFARFEKVSHQLKDPEAQNIENENRLPDQRATEHKNLQAEFIMLKQVLEWLEISPHKKYE